jgi:hypothetical protein
VDLVPELEFKKESSNVTMAIFPDKGGHDSVNVKKKGII